MWRERELWETELVAGRELKRCRKKSDKVT